MKLETLSGQSERDARITMIRRHGRLLASVVGVELFVMPGGSAWLIQDNNGVFLGTCSKQGALGAQLEALINAMNVL